MQYNREDFYKAIHKIRNFYIKKGYFKVDVSYLIENVSNSNSVIVQINIKQGFKGYVSDIIFDGFTKREKKNIMNVIRIRKFNSLTSWITGSGIIKEEEFDQDIQSIVQYMQNLGYVDANVDMSVQKIDNDKLVLIIKLNRGQKYHINNISFSGYDILSEDNLQKAINIKHGDTFSIDKIRETQEKIKELYTKDGYINTNVDYTLNLNQDSRTYDINFSVEESGQYRVGLVMLTGNYYTTKNVIYNNIDIEPGDVFNSTKIKSTQNKLRSTGYFKNVNVYPVKCEENPINSSEYCDVMIEVNEVSTGNIGLFAGFSSTDNIFGGIDIVENNFNMAGLTQLFSEGPRAVRGGGQFLQIRGQIGARDKNISTTWLEPYFNNSLWRVGLEFNYGVSSVLSRNYSLNTLGGAVSAKYPVSPYFTYGFRYRIKNSVIKINPIKNKKLEDKLSENERKRLEDEQTKLPKSLLDLARSERLNSGVTSGIALTLGYDSTDNTFKPRRGIKSNAECELAALIRDSDIKSDFPFLKSGWLNSFYNRILDQGTLKLRCDFKFINPLLIGSGLDIPLTERFFLGGESTVRGYGPGKIGPKIGGDIDDPSGGISSTLVSIEYLHNIFKPLDAFVFFDAGSISMDKWRIGRIKTSVGFGARIDIGKQLPFVVGLGFPLNRDHKSQVQTVFFSMAG